MEKLIKALDVHRTSFTRIYETTIRLLQSPEVKICEVQSNLKVLEQKMNALVELDKQLVNLMLDSDSLSEQIDEEVEKADMYLCQYNNLRFQVDEHISSMNLQESCSSAQVIQLPQSPQKLKWPKIEIKKFNGDVSTWMAFWSQFKRIHEDRGLENEDKFQYLIQATVPNSRARLIVDSYPPTAENYPKAIESLKSRFGREDLLVEVYVRELLRLILSNIKKTPKISFIYDKIGTQLRALDSLGVTSDKCGAMLYPLIESCLPEDTLRVWQRTSTFSAEDSLKIRLDQLMLFLKREVENEERVNLAASSKFDLQKEKSDDQVKLSPARSASALVNMKPVKCIFCKMEHSSEDCSEAYKMTLPERRKILSSRGCCHRCLKFGHIAKRCRTAAYLKCKNCGDKHVALMCAKSCSAPQLSPLPIATTENLSNNTSTEVFLQTLMVLLKGKHKIRAVRAVIDTGSQRSYINKHILMDMDIDMIGKEDIIHDLFGGSQSEVISHSAYRINLESLDRKYACSLQVLDQPLICNEVAYVCEGPWTKELQELKISITDTKEGPIEILLGADVAGKLFCGPRHVLRCGLVALKTSLGWTLLGKTNAADIHNSRRFVNATSMFSRAFSCSDLWSLDVLGIIEPEAQKSTKDQEAALLKRFSEQVTRDEEGRYEVGLLWKEGHPPLPSNLALAKNRLDRLIEKLRKDGYYEEYNEVFDDWLAEGIIEKLTIQPCDNVGHYLPHRHVVKLSSATTRLRPVFDASARQKNSPSLNQCLEKGVNLIALIPTIFLGFRVSKIGVIADIRKAFLQIGLREEERDFLRFLWCNQVGDLLLYRHARVVFGVCCSPFLLGAVITHHLQNLLQKNKNKFSARTIQKLLRSFYVDNCITSVDSEEELQEFMKDSKAIMLDGKFDLRCWEFTAPQATGLTPVLGMLWEKSTDALKINLENLKHVQCECVTKKLILSVTNSVFDPLGLVSPVVLLPKLQLQKSWTLKLGWNEEVPNDIRHDFLRWLKNLNVLTNLRIPRWLMLNCGSSDQELSLHVFSDASKSAYAAVVFLRTKFSHGTEVQLVQAKSRVSPLKNMTMPRLELLAASIGVRLLLSITEVYLNGAETFFWTDSTTVLAWIKRRERWKPFVWNRVQEIRKYSRPECWFHVPGRLNPADLPTRGCDAEQLLNSRWWQGPPWLYEDRSLWPEQEYNPDEDLVIGEQRKGDISLLNSSRSDNSWVYKYFSKYHRIVRLIGWIKRFSFNCRNDSKQKDDLSVEELKQAEKLLIKIVQQETYGDAEDQISSLSPFLDEDGIIRLKTKITERDDVDDFRYPAVLPSSHPVVFRLIWDTHMKNLHVGTQGVLSILRERFWIVRGRRSVKSVISKCMICQRFNSKPWDTIPVALPKDRVKEAAAFEVTGVDVFGYLLLKGNIKVWVCIFTCAVYRAIHLELMSSLSTECFLQAFRRFIARRGRPSVVYSDNARNFTGANNALNSLNWEEIERKHKIDKISWKFNVPTAAWWGGWWERLIRMCKQILRKVCGRACLNYEELSSILCDCESVINSRPLTYLAEDHSDLATLTPAMFIQDMSKAGVADLDEIESKDLNRRHRYRLRLKVELRKRFRQEYLGQLMLKKRKSCNKTLKVGDVVLVEDDTIKRIGWPLARIEQLFPGKDGVPRVAKVRTVNGSMMRPIQRLYPLEVDQDEGGGFNMKDVIEDKKKTETVTRSGRVSRPPRRFE